MTSETDRMQRYKKALNIERARIVGNIESLHPSNSTGLTFETEENGLETHLGDMATDTYLRERDISLEEHEEQLLGEIDGALERISKGSFGVCLQCGQRIPDDRLEAIPWAGRCMKCQSDA